MGTGASHCVTEDGEPLLSRSALSLNDEGDDDSFSQSLRDKRHHRCAAWWRRRHCGHRVPRWAIGLCAASVLLLLAVLAVLTFTLIIPKVIDTLMADSTIEFELIRLSKPGSSSLFLDAQGKIKANALLPATIRSFPLAVHYREQLLGRTVMPDITLSTGGDTGFATSALMEIADMSTFNQFGQDMIHAHSLSWRLSGSTVVGVLGLSYSIKFDKVVAIPAFDGLKHVNIEAFDLASSNETNINTRLNVSIFNPSVISIVPIGLLHMDIMYKGSRIAMAHTTERVNMDVGANYLMMEGTVLPQNISLFEEVIGNYLRGLPCNVTAVAAKANVTDIPLYRPTLANFTLETVLEGMHSGLILEANFTSMQLVPVNSTSALLSANVSIVIDPLLGNRSLLEVEKVALGVDLIYVVEDDDAGPSGAALLSTHLREAKDRELVIGHIQTDQAIVPTGQHGAIVNITIDHQYLQIEGDQITANFIEFVVAFIQRPQSTASLLLP